MRLSETTIPEMDERKQMREMILWRIKGNLRNKKEDALFRGKTDMGEGKMEIRRITMEKCSGCSSLANFSRRAYDNPEEAGKLTARTCVNARQSGAV